MTIYLLGAISIKTLFLDVCKVGICPVQAVTFVVILQRYGVDQALQRQHFIPIVVKHILVDAISCGV